MESKEKVLLVAYASWEKRETGLEYPLYHTLVFYLSRFKGVEFPEYTFVPRAFSDEQYIQSERLAEHISDLVGRRLLSFDGQQVPTVCITQMGAKRARHDIAEFEREGDYEPFRAGVIEALDIDKATFYRSCYARYVQELASSQG